MLTYPKEKLIELLSVAGSSGKQEHSDKREQPIERREGQIPSERIVFRNQGGISFKIG